MCSWCPQPYFVIAGSLETNYGAGKPICKESQTPRPAANMETRINTGSAKVRVFDEPPLPEHGHAWLSAVSAAFHLEYKLICRLAVLTESPRSAIAPFARSPAHWDEFRPKSNPSNRSLVHLSAPN